MASGRGNLITKSENPMRIILHGVLAYGYQKYT
jgi:hypothetical protein